MFWGVLLLNYFLKYISFLLFWFVLNAKFSLPNLFIGLIACFIVLKIDSLVFKSHDISKNLNQNDKAILRVIWLFLIVIVEIFKAAFEHILRILKGSDASVIIHIALDVTHPLYITLIANAITLTPGTLTIKSQGNILTIVGFAQTEEDKAKIVSTIIDKFQKPFLYHRR